MNKEKLFDKSLVLELTKKGYTSREIHRKTGFSERALYNFLKSKGLLRSISEAKRAKFERIKKINIGDLINLHLQDKMSLAAISRVKHIGAQTLGRRFKEKGIKPRFYREGNLNTAWKGGKSIRNDGYVLIHSPSHPHAINGYILEHRLVMEKSLGRYLKSNEHIHHIDGNRSNNSINNLLLVKGSRGHIALFNSIHPVCRELIARGYIGFDKARGVYFLKPK